MALLTGGIAKMVAGATKTVTYPLTLHRVLKHESDEAWEKTVTTNFDYPCLGMVGQYKESFVDGTRIQAGDKKCLIIANSLDTTPRPGDFITAQGKRYSVVDVGRDPATATWTVQVR